MPIGQYPSFDACVEANEDKRNPAAYCASIEKAITGKWPGQKHSLTEGLSEDAEALFFSILGRSAGVDLDEVLRDAHLVLHDSGWAYRNGKWFKTASLQQFKTRTIVGVQIFASGTHNGDPYTKRDLENIVNAYYALKGRIDPPIKLGHTSDDFNKALAQKMGIGAELLTGEVGGKGAIAIGWVENLRMDGDVILGDFANVPEAVADLIDAKSLNKVSSEIMFDVDDQDHKYPMVLSGVALLGAELPAVRDLDGLDKVAVFTQVGPSQKQYEHNWEEIAKGKFSQKEVKHVKEICLALGLAEDSTAEQVQAKITEVVEGVGKFKALFAELGLAEADYSVDKAILAVKALKAPPAEKKELADVKAKLASQEQEISNLTAKVKASDRKVKLAEYTAKATEWKAIQGKPEDIAEELVQLEEINPKAAESLVARYTQIDSAAKKAGLFVARGTSAESEDKPHPFLVEVEKKMATDPKLTQADAFAAVRKENTKLFREYMAGRPKQTTVAVR